MTIQAKYEDGVFKPLAAVKIEEGSVVEIEISVPQQEKAQPRSIRELGFAGMWSYRDDIADGASYVNHIRDTPRG
jgi:predicted DNA-binding antitoxin AbrB/MazE fold protein